MNVGGGKMRKKVVTMYPTQRKGATFGEKLSMLYRWTENLNWYDFNLFQKALVIAASIIEFPIALSLSCVGYLTTKIAQRRNAKIQEEYNSVDGQKDGAYCSYYKNGQIKVKSFYRKGQLEGPYEEYYENGRLKRKGTCKDDKFDGPYEQYYEAGQLMGKGTCKNDKIDGLYEVFYPSGKLKEKGTWQNGQMTGPAERYYENGQLKEKGTMEDGCWTGPYESYYENGQLEKKAFGKGKHWSGPYEEYHKNGRISLTCFYEEGKKDGPSKEYSEDGKLIKDEVYRNGTLLKGQEAAAYLEEWNKQQLEKDPAWLEVTKKLEHLTDDVYYRPIKPARTPERTEKAKKLMKVRRGAELLAKAIKEAKTSKKTTLLSALKKLAHPFAKEEMFQRRVFSRLRESRRIRRKQKDL